MNDAELCIRFVPDEGTYGQIAISVRSGAFSGKGAAWFDAEYVREGFIAALREFPYSSANPPKLEGGLARKDGTWNARHICISVVPHDALGTLRVEVDVTSEALEMRDVGLQQSASLRFLAQYADLATFADELECALARAGHLALLKTGRS